MQFRFFERNLATVRAVAWLLEIGGVWGGGEGG